MLRGMAWRKVSTHTAIPVCNELLEQRQGRDSNMSQMDTYLEEGNSLEDKHQTDRWREEPPPPLLKCCSGSHILQVPARGTSSSTWGKGFPPPAQLRSKEMEELLSALANKT